MDKRLGKLGFSGRLIEACRTSKPADVKRLLNISYQAAKNYLSEERLPNARILIQISEHTNCSIDWLLTGRGKKFIHSDLEADTPISTRQIESIARKVCVEVINERLGDAEARLKIVQLHSSEVLSEKVLEQPKTVTQELDR